MIATASDIECDDGVITVARRPRRWMWMRSATSKTCGMLWLIRITGSPRSRTSRISCSTRLPSLTPSAAVGSSRITTLLPNAADRATATPWRCPPDRLSTACPMFCSVAMPSSLMCRLASSRMCLRSSIRNTVPSTPGLRCSRPRNRLSAMSRPGATARVW